MKLIEQRGERIAGYVPVLPVYLAGRGEMPCPF